MTNHKDQLLLLLLAELSALAYSDEDLSDIDQYTSKQIVIKDVYSQKDIAIPKLMYANDYSLMHTIYCKESDIKVLFFERKFLKETSEFDGIDIKIPELVISIRGSSSFANFCTDIDVRPSYTERLKGVPIHSGFLNAAFSIRYCINEFLDDIYAHKKYKRIHTCGHSLGGAIGLLLLVLNSLDKDVDWSSDLTTFGCPKVMGKLKSNVINHNRCVLGGDIIPILPFFSFYYKHQEKHICLDDSKIKYCLRIKTIFNHNISKYISALQK